SLVARSSALAIREMPYVDAARAAGFRHRRIILRHMLPNVMAPYLIMLTAFLGQAILLEASLSFLGLGVAEPTPAWGLMLRGAAVLFIHPDECIDCGACEPVCPVKAIFAEDEVPDQWKKFTDMNKQFFKDNPGVQPAKK